MPPRSLTKRSTSGRPKNERTGKLRIGDQWNAISIIGRLQTHPLKAICELTENAIDAGASKVQIIRRRRKGQNYLEVNDDGRGVQPSPNGEPDFAKIATQVCNSMKRHLDSRQRTGVHGEFGIGLLSFWSLGEELRMISAGSKSRLYELILSREKPEYTIRPIRGELSYGGTRVIVGPLLEATKNVVTGEKIAKFLATELRDRIRQTGVTVEVIDRISHRNILVQPREFEGDPVDLPRTIPTPLGSVRVELYFRDDSHAEETGVAVCKDGTRVLKDITQLDQFQRAPWTEGKLEGVLDFASFQLAPGTRDGIVPDENLQAFQAAIEELELELQDRIANRQQAESDKASRTILKKVHQAFTQALRELPPSEYLFFDIPDEKNRLGRSKNDAASRTEGGSQESMALDSTNADESAGNVREETPIFIPLDAGPLAKVRISPRYPKRKPGEPCTLSAMATDEWGARLVDDVQYQWRIETDIDARMHAAAEQPESATVESDQEGIVTVHVTAHSQGNVATDQVDLKFLINANQTKDGTTGLPSYRLESEPGRPTRSRYDASKNEIIINSGHRDFVSSRATPATHRRYIGKLYAKEVVLINFPHESPAEIMERLIQLTLRTEAVL